MSAPLEFQAGDRLLVIAPHPDDESLGCGGLIQHALAAGAQVRVLIVTDGDNNPWPQRRLEHRWSIDAAARRRWGARRRAEARAALRVLGVAADDVEFLGWPDQGVTRRLLDQGSEAVAALTQRLAAWTPQRIAAPTREDTHPDHSAIRLWLDAALTRLNDRHVRVLGYGIHGTAAHGDVVLKLDAAAFARKRDAVLCHASQAAFGLGRLLRFVAAEERFEMQVPALSLHGAQWRGRLALGGWPLRHARRDLLLLGWNRQGEVRSMRISAPSSRSAEVELDANGQRLRWQRRDAAVSIDLPALWPDAVVAVVKLSRRGLPWLVFDDAGWSSLEPVDAAAAQRLAA